MDSVGFKLFLSLWNRVQDQATPEVHFRIAGWLEEAWVRGDRRLLLMAFRSCGKSTIVGLFAAWLLYRNPDLRVLVLAAESALAGKMVRNVKRIIERHPLTGHMKPERLDQWGSDRFTVNRALELRDPSMLGVGLGGNMTGSRADIVICDDVEVPRTSDTADKRAELRERLSEIDFILTPGGTRLYAGTPHSWFSIYAEAPRTEIGEIEPFLKHFSRMMVPIIENGRSAWPERFPMEEIEAIRRSTGPHKFSSQMMLKPMNIAEGRLDPAQMVRYGGAVHKSEILKELYLNGKRITAISAWWDPAFGSGRGDGSVVAVVYVDEDGKRYLHRVAYLNCGDMEGDEAARQCAAVADLVRELYVPALSVETNGIGKFLPEILKKEFERQKVRCGIRPATSSVAKDRRILEAFDVMLAAKLLHVHDDVYRTPFINEMQEWQPGGKGRDDGLDAAAGALSLEPVRPRGAAAPGGFKAKTDFRV